MNQSNQIKVCLILLMQVWGPNVTRDSNDEIINNDEITLLDFDFAGVRNKRYNVTGQAKAMYDFSARGHERADVEGERDGGHHQQGRRT